VYTRARTNEKLFLYINNVPKKIGKSWQILVTKQNGKTGAGEKSKNGMPMSRSFVLWVWAVLYCFLIGFFFFSRVFGTR
jgi:hypothetical protein